ncbi:PREDICTED: transmembrane protein 59-like [Branchiostoma belcheri]|uniref:Transmembrane protein 59-like n=1 Tax=Branchiostoma belcheri TaxID=7741 RepID=A0A6P4ZW45_BRABE|nr:PREDICTED: transmembrane protein 59-like [Branchiostoma belcheri]
MATPKVLMLTLASFFSLSTASESFDQLLGDVTPCIKSCEMTYPLHTYPKQENLYACRRGCRLFSIVEFIGESRDLNATKDACDAACMEAYRHVDDRYGCSIGCRSQVPFARKRKQQRDEEVQKIHFLTPMMMVRNIYSDLLSRAQNYMSVSWSLYMQSDNGKIIVLKSEPEVFVDRIIPEDDNFHFPRSELRPEVSLDLLDDLDLELDDRRLQPREPRLQRISQDANWPGRPQPAADWLGCVSKKSGLPRWLLSSTLFLSVLAILWLCCATSATAQEQTLKQPKLSIYGDMETIVAQQKSAPGSVVEVPTLETPEEQAGPLPVKIKVDHSMV